MFFILFILYMLVAYTIPLEIQQENCIYRPHTKCSFSKLLSQFQRRISFLWSFLFTIIYHFIIWHKVLQYSNVWAINNVASTLLTIKIWWVRFDTQQIYSKARICISISSWLLRICAIWWLLYRLFEIVALHPNILLGPRPFLFHSKPSKK